MFNPHLHRKIFVAFAWPYVNGDLHMGHYAGYLLPADICARYHRLRGREVLMVSGSDAHGTPTTIEADKRGMTPLQVVEEYHPKRLELFKLLNLSHDLFTRTDTPNHKKISQDVFLALLNKGYIFKDFSMQYYSEEEKRFLPDRYVEGRCPICDFDGARSDQCDNCGSLLDEGTLINPLSKNTKTPVKLKETQHYFIDWPKLQPFLENYVSRAGGWRSWVLAETQGWLKQGLKPRAITRDLDWGVEIPTDRIPSDMQLENAESKRFYVWFEAVIGYLSASIEWAQNTGKDWKAFWYSENSYHYYFMGKDNLMFHTLFWPAQIHVYDEFLQLPDNPAINQFLNLENQKFSKSRGVTLDPSDMVKEFGNDSTRFYLCSIMPENEDANFSWEEFYQKTNNVLIANYGNLVNRVFTLSKGVDFSNRSSADLMFFNTADGRESVAFKIEETFGHCYTALETCRYKDYLNAVMELSTYANTLMSLKAPWKLKESDTVEFENVLYNLNILVIAVTALLQPLLPDTTAKLFDHLKIDVDAMKLVETDKVLDLLTDAFKSVKIESGLALFQKLEKSQIENR